MTPADLRRVLWQAATQYGAEGTRPDKSSGGVG